MPENDASQSRRVLRGFLTFWREQAQHSRRCEVGSGGPLPDPVNLPPPDLLYSRTSGSCPKRRLACGYSPQFCEGAP